MTANTCPDLIERGAKRIAEILAVYFSDNILKCSQNLL